MKKKDLLVLILIISAILRLAFLSRGDTVNDEVFMSFRGLGMIDFDEAAAQTTPLEWWDEYTPWWANLSFHDHPILVPATQNVFMRAFGENNFAFRLPSALLGTASVYLIYLIGAYLYSVNVGLISAAFLGVTLNNIYISRTGMQEPYVIFFLLLGLYLFLRALKEEKFWPWVGVAAGLGAEAKYNSLIIIPIIFSYLVFFRRDCFFRKKFWLAVFTFFLIFSPTIIYNIGLYSKTGHFDFQFSYIFGQHPEVWKTAPGKEIGSLAQRIQNFIPRLAATNSWLFLLAAGLSLAGIFGQLFNKLKEPACRQAGIFAKHGFLAISLFFLIALLLLIGPSYRFLTMLAPFLALGIGVFFDEFYRQFLVKKEKIAYLVLALILLFEIFYAINNQISYYPVGPEPWLFSKVRFENYNWGYNELGKYLDQELAGLMPGITFDLKYRFLEKLRMRALNKGREQGLKPYPALIIYNGNFDRAARLWVLDRLHIYHAWPIISLETYYEYLRQNGSDYFDRVGFERYYFISQMNVVSTLEEQALSRGTLISIYNPRGDEAFKIYKF